MFHRTPGLEFVGDMTAHMDNYKRSFSPSLVDTGSIRSGALSEATLVPGETEPEILGKNSETAPLGASIEMGSLESTQKEMMGHVYAVKTGNGYDMVVHYTGPAGGLVKIEFYVIPKEKVFENHEAAMVAVEMADLMKKFKQVVLGLPKFTETINVLFKGPMASGQESIVVETIPLASSCKNVEEMSWSWITFVPSDFAADGNYDLVFNFNKTPLVEVQPYIDSVQMTTLVEEAQTQLLVTHDMLVWFHLKNFDCEVPVWSTFTINKTFLFLLNGIFVTHNTKPIKFKVVCGLNSMSLSCSYIDAPENLLRIKFTTLVPRQTMVYSLPCINSGTNQSWKTQVIVKSKIERPLMLIDNGQEQDGLDYMANNSNTELAIYFKEDHQSVRPVIHKAHYAVHIEDSGADKEKKVDLTVHLKIETDSQPQGVPIAIMNLAGWDLPEYCWVNREPARFVKTGRGLAVLAKTSGPTTTVELFWKKKVFAFDGGKLFYSSTERYFEGELPYLEHEVTEVTSRVDPNLEGRFSTIEQLKSDSCAPGKGRKVKAMLGGKQRQTKRQLLCALIFGVCYILAMTYVLPSLPERSPAQSTSKLLAISGLAEAQRLIIGMASVAALPVCNMRSLATSQGNKNSGELATATVTETETAIDIVTVIASCAVTATTETAISTITTQAKCNQADDAELRAHRAAELKKELEACNKQMKIHVKHFSTLQSQFKSLDWECANGKRSASSCAG